MGVSISKKRILRTARKKTNYEPPFGEPLADNPLIFFEIAMTHNGRGFLLGKIIVELKADLFPQRSSTIIRHLDTEPNRGPIALDKIIPHLFCQVDLDDLEILPGFENHNSNLTHEAAGVVWLGLDYLSPQLLFATGALPWLNQTHFILGQVVDGYEVLKAMELCGTSSGDLIFDVVIIRCGLGHGDDGDRFSATSSSVGRQHRRNIHFHVLKPFLIPVMIGGCLCLFLYPVYCMKKIRKFLRGIWTFIVESSFKLRAHLSFD